MKHQVDSNRLLAEEMRSLQATCKIYLLFVHGGSFNRALFLVSLGMKYGNIGFLSSLGMKTMETLGFFLNVYEPPYEPPKTGSAVPLCSGRADLGPFRAVPFCRVPRGVGVGLKRCHLRFLRVWKCR